MSDEDWKLVAVLAIFVALNLLVVVVLLLPHAYGAKLASVVDAATRMLDALARALRELAGVLRAEERRLDARRQLRQTPKPKKARPIGYGRGGA